MKDWNTKTEGKLEIYYTMVLNWWHWIVRSVNWNTQQLAKITMIFSSSIKKSLGTEICVMTNQQLKPELHEWQHGDCLKKYYFSVYVFIYTVFIHCMLVGGNVHKYRILFSFIMLFLANTHPFLGEIQCFWPRIFFYLTH